MEEKVADFMTIGEASENRMLVLVIYDISDDKKRFKLVKFLQGFGFRVQKSAFEAMISKSVYRRLLQGLPEFISEEDSIRVYKIVGKKQVIEFGRKTKILEEEIIIV